MSLLIVESGSTKSDWCLIENDLKILSFQLDGVNPYVHSLEKITNVFNGAYAKLNSFDLINKIQFYGAGCSSNEMKIKIKEACRNSNFDTVKIEVSHDLLASARALLGNKEGIACILGTGSNSCVYDGRDIVDELPAFGYLIADEGGGFDLGKRLINTIFKREAPAKLIDLFESKYHLTPDIIKHKIYFEEGPNKFVASFSIFLKENIENEFCRNLVYSSFQSFIHTNLKKYERHEILPISFVGSVAWNFKDILLDVIKNEGLTAGKILKSPLEGLIDFHLNETSAKF